MLMVRELTDEEIRLISKNPTLWQPEIMVLDAVLFVRAVFEAARIEQCSLIDDAIDDYKFEEDE